MTAYVWLFTRTDQMDFADTTAEEYRPFGQQEEGDPELQFKPEEMKIFKTKRQAIKAAVESLNRHADHTPAFQADQRPFGWDKFKTIVEGAEYEAGCPNYIHRVQRVRYYDN